MYKTQTLKSRKTHQLLSDEDLLIRIIRQDNTLLFRKLYLRYEADVYNKCFEFLKSKETASVLAQNVFDRLYETKKNFSGKMKFSTWLYGLTYLMCVDYLAKGKAKEVGRYPHEAENNSHLQIEVSDAILFQMNSKKLSKAMELIEPEDKAILLLKYQDNVSIEELVLLYKKDKVSVLKQLKKAKARIVETYNEL